MRSHEVQCPLMGGQACIIYGAAEFSRDAGLAVLADLANLRRLHAALDELQAEVIAVPPFEADYLTVRFVDGTSVAFGEVAPAIAIAEVA